MTAYVTIAPSARQSFERAQMELNQAARSFAGSFATADTIKSASESLARAEQSLRATRKALG